MTKTANHYKRILFCSVAINLLFGAFIYLSEPKACAGVMPANALPQIDMEAPVITPETFIIPKRKP